MKLTEFIIAGVLASSVGLVTFAKGASSSGGRSSSRSSSSSRSASTSPVSWSSSAKYGTGSGKLVGKSPLSSKTKPPQPHTHNGKKYNSSKAIYTNPRGQWVYYWIPIGGAIYCYDKDHKRIDCDRDDKSYMKDW